MESLRSSKIEKKYSMKFYNIVISNIETVLFHKNRIIETTKYIPVEKIDIIDVKLIKEININTL